MPYKSFFYLTVLGLIAGFLLVSFQKNWIILYFTPINFSNTAKQNRLPTFHKKTVSLFFWKNNSWHNEQADILWGHELEANLTNLIQSWLTIIDEEQLTVHKITLQTALISYNSQIAYLSFDQNLLSSNSSTYQKLMLIEGLLKTLRHNHITIPSIQLLVQHQLIDDHHLDFSNPWPISGFLS